jgi:myosin III
MYLQVHDKYVGKSRTENPPHVFAVADSAYADMMHHKEDQHIVMGGESYSGKSTNVWFLIKHLNIIGAGIPFVGLRIEHALSIITAFTHAGTPVNPNSTRCILQSEMTFNATGKSSGAHFYVTNLEKLRVSSTNM